MGTSSFDLRGITCCAGVISLYRSLDSDNVCLVTLGNEHLVTALVILGIFGVAIYRLVLWIMQAPRTGDPWGKETDEAVNQADAVPVCYRCFTPQEHNGWFCPECGATVGPYCNYMPYIYIFSQGEVLRAGVTERIRRSRLVTIGFVLFSLGMFAVAAPIYWFFLFKNLRRVNDEAPEAPPLASG